MATVMRPLFAPVSDAPSMETVMRLEKEVAEAHLRGLIDTTEAKEEVAENVALVRDFKHLSITIFKSLLDLMCKPEPGSSVILDDALLASRPVNHEESGETFDLTNSALLRILDSTGKTSVIILGIVPSPSAMRTAYDEPDSTGYSWPRHYWPRHCFDVDTWLRDLADDLHDEGALSERGVSLFCVSKGIILHVETEESFLVRYSVLTDPVGFPLSQMRLVTRRQEPNGNVRNAEAEREVGAV